MNKKIILKNVSVIINNHKILKDINLVINEGERVAIVGPNGAGKTTLMMTILSQIIPSQGIVENDFDIIPDSKKGIILQSMSLNGLMLVKEVMALFNFTKDSNERFISEYGLSKIMKKKIASLSGGEKQKVMLASTFQNNPEIFFVDEITTGLDMVNRKKTLQYLEEYTRYKSTTMLYITHYFEELEGLIDRVVIMDEGQIIEDGNIDELFKKYNINEKLFVNLNSKKIEHILNFLVDFEYELLEDSKLIVNYKNKDELVNLINILHQNNDLYQNYNIVYPSINRLYNSILKGGIQ